MILYIIKPYKLHVANKRILPWSVATCKKWGFLGHFSNFVNLLRPPARPQLI